MKTTGINTIRFGFCGGTLWAFVTLLLVILSLLKGNSLAWIELDFKPLTGALMLAANALGHGAAFGNLAHIAENGLPFTRQHTSLCALLSFADGFTSGFLIASLNNTIARLPATSRLPFSVRFALAVGIVFGLSSGLLALVVLVYTIDIPSFGFALRPLWGLFYALSDWTSSEVLEALRHSYTLFPKSIVGALAWIGWGFLDGFTGGIILCPLYLRIRQRSLRGQPTP